MGNRTDGEQGLAARIARLASRLIAVAMASTMVVACAALDQLFDPPAAETEAPASVAPPSHKAEEALPRAPRPRPTRTARLPTPAERAASSPAAESQPEDTAKTPDPVTIPLPEIKLVGLSRNDAVTLFGAPKGEREAAPAKIWEFSDGECVLDVYFYLDVARNDFYALHYDVRDANGAMAGPAADRCVQRIYSENHR